jgi:hypothetical protein
LFIFTGPLRHVAQLLSAHRKGEHAAPSEPTPVRSAAQRFATGDEPPAYEGHA